MLAGALATPITLLSAPAGFGKTALLAGWWQELDAPRAWLSVDAHDNVRQRMWEHLIAAIRQLAPGVGDDALAELRRRGGRGHTDRWLTSLINDLAAATAPDSILALDDLHLLTAAPVRESIGELAAGIPPWLHLIISTRADPPLPLHRLRADGRLTEIREVGLRFRPDEAAALLAANGAPTMDADQVARLVERTEGWAAGLQLAAMTAEAGAVDSQLEGMTGDLRPFSDYLIAEVVDRQPPETRDFLFATAVADRINPSLAAALSGVPSSGRALRNAADQGLFLNALDGDGEWYRYHQVFAEVLRHHLRVRDPEAWTATHSAAAQWFEDHGDIATALEHWLSAGRPAEALRLALDVGFGLVDRGNADAVEAIVRRIPLSAVGDDPARQLDYGLLHLTFDPETFLTWTTHAGESIARLDEPDVNLVTQHHAVRAVAAIAVGAWDAALVHATAAADTTGGQERSTAQRRSIDHAQRAQLQVIRAAGWLEHLSDAETAFHRCRRDPRVPDALRATLAPSAWALAAALAGRIDVADHWRQRADEAADASGFHHEFAHAERLLARAMVERERGDSGAAIRTLDELHAIDVRSYFSLRSAAEVERALVGMEQRRLDAAADALDAALNVRPAGPVDRLVVARVDLVRSSWHLETGDIEGARRAAGRMPPGVWQDVAHARACLTDGAYRDAERMLRDVAPMTPRQFATVEMLRALALADRAPDAARDHVVGALDEAMNAGLSHTVLACGAGVGELIERASWVVPAQWIEHAHVVLANGAAGRVNGHVAGLVDQPTVRERDVLRFLPGRLTVPEIARELGVSPNTLKTHLKGLYRKLGVTSRDDAVTVARDLGLVR